MKYEIEVTFKRPKLKDKTLHTSFNMKYNDEDYVRCEDMIRDELKSIADKFITSEFYE